MLIVKRLMLLPVLLLLGCSGPAEHAASQSATVKLMAVGDVLLARDVGKQIKVHGPEYPFLKSKETLSGTDLALFNLECPLSRRGSPQRRRFLFRADPDLAKTLRANGMTVAVLANNHTMDYGRDALMDTVAAIKSAGIVAVGAGKDRADAHSVQVVEKNGLRIGFLAYTDLPFLGVVSLDDRPSVCAVDKSSLPDEIRSAKSKCDVLVVSFHWGIEYAKRPTERQQEIAHIAVDNGADAVIGHHPHVLQTVETYKKKPIIYSAGGFVWDPIYPGTYDSAIYELELGKLTARLTKTIPIKIEKCQPRPTATVD